MKHKTIIRGIALFAAIVIVVALSTYLISYRQIETFAENEVLTVDTFPRQNGKIDVTLVWKGSYNDVTVKWQGNNNGSKVLTNGEVYYTIPTLTAGVYNFTVTVNDSSKKVLTAQYNVSSKGETKQFIQNFSVPELTATFEFNKNANNPSNADVSVSWNGLNGVAAISYTGPSSGNLNYIEKKQYTIRNLKPGDYRFKIISYNDGLPKVDINIPVKPTGATIIFPKSSSQALSSPYEPVTSTSFQAPQTATSPMSSSQSTSWSSVITPSQLKQVSHSGTNVCGVTDKDAILCKFSSQEWKTMPGLLKQISVDGDRACGVNGGNEIFCTDNIKAPSWQKLPGLLKQVDLQGDNICGVNTNQEVFCSTYKDGNWNKKGGLLDHISINNGKACGVTVNGEVFCADDINTMSWQKVDGILKQIDLDNKGLMCGVNANGDVYCSNYKTNNWKNVGPPGKYISIDNNTAYVVGKDGSLKSNGNLGN